MRLKVRSARAPFVCVNRNVNCPLISNVDSVAAPYILIVLLIKSFYINSIINAYFMSIVGVCA